VLHHLSRCSHFNHVFRLYNTTFVHSYTHCIVVYTRFCPLCTECWSLLPGLSRADCIYTTRTEQMGNIQLLRRRRRRRRQKTRDIQAADPTRARIYTASGRCITKGCRSHTVCTITQTAEIRPFYGRIHWSAGDIAARRYLQNTVYVYSLPGTC